MAKKRAQRGSVGKRTQAKKSAAPKKRAASKTKKTAARKATRKATAKKPVATPKRKRAGSAPRRKSSPAASRPVSADRQPPPSQTNGNHKQSSGLRAREIDDFRRMLLNKRAELVGNVSHLHAEAMRQNRQDAAGDLSSMPIHMADIGTDNYEQEFTLGLIESERAILREIDEALRRIEDGTYGLCVATGQPIGKKRLKANPWAKYCYEYKLAQEKGMMRRP